MILTWLETTQGIITLISSGVAIVGGVITLVVSLVKKVKEVVKLVKEKKYDELIAQLKKTADETIRAVESSKESGADKKATVLEAVQAACNSLGSEFTDDLKEQISTFIDNSVAEYNEFKKSSKK